MIEFIKICKINGSVLIRKKCINFAVLVIGQNGFNRYYMTNLLLHIIKNTTFKNNYFKVKKDNEL